MPLWYLVARLKACGNLAFLPKLACGNLAEYIPNILKMKSNFNSRTNTTKQITSIATFFGCGNELIMNDTLISPNSLVTLITESQMTCKQKPCQSQMTSNLFHFYFFASVFGTVFATRRRNPIFWIIQKPGFRFKNLYPFFWFPLVP